MYFDHCESPKELGKAIGSVLTTVTYRRLNCAGLGPHIATLVGPLEEQTLREALLEARSLVERFRKGNPELPPMPDMRCYPLEGLLKIGAWCDEAERIEGRRRTGGMHSAHGHTTEKPVLPPANGRMTEQEVRQVREHADRVAELLEPMEMPPLAPTWESEPPGLDHTNRVAQRMADEWDRVLHPLKVEYRKKVVAILEDDWEPIADIFEHYAPQTFQRLDGWRREILDHTDPARKYVYWLECSDGKFGPNPDLKNRIENLVGKLRRRADRAETAASRTKTDLEKPESDSTGQGQPLGVPGLIERLKRLRSALGGGDENPISQTRGDLEAYIGSPERLYDALQEPLRGGTADSLERLKQVGDARRSRTNMGLYPALLDALAVPEFTAELERWLARPNGSEVGPGDEKERGASKEHPWNDRDSDYMGASEAVQVAEKLNRRISLPTLSRLLKKADCPIRFMRRSNRARVHIADFKAYLETRPKIKPTGEDISDEALDEYLADAHATREAMRRRKSGTGSED